MNRYLYSRSTGGFYIERVHGDEVPSDAVEVSEEEHAALMAAQTQGKRIAANTDTGRPMATDQAPATSEVREWSLRQRRGAMLARTDGLVARDRDERQMGHTPTLSDEQLQQLMRYRQQLRDLTQVEGFPNVDFPPAPAFVR